MDGKNYLIPSDANIPDERRLVTRAVNSDEVMLALLEAAPNRIVIDGEAVFRWGPRNSYVGETVPDVGRGFENTQRIMEVLGPGGHAAHFAVEYEAGGFTDWFLPSKDELEIVLREAIDVVDFPWKHGPYWSSTEQDELRAWQQRARNRQLNTVKISPQGVWPIRRF